MPKNLKSYENMLRSILFDNNSINFDNESNYRVYSIPKSSTGKRIICEPAPFLKSALEKLLPFIKAPNVSKNCAAYEKGCSTYKNAKIHINGKHILHLDIRDFFPSIDSKMFWNVYGKGMSLNVMNRLWSAVSYKGGLAIGAATSPFIANRVLTELDKKLNKLSIFIKYTRYADDLIFSSKKPIKDSFRQKVEKLIYDAGFRVNHKKTYYMHSRKQVTGLIITPNKTLSVGTSYKKRLKSDIYNYIVNNIGHPDVIKGKFSYLKQIEPEYARRIKQKYLPYDKNNFVKNL